MQKRLNKVSEKIGCQLGEDKNKMAGRTLSERAHPRLKVQDWQLHGSREHVCLQCWAQCWRSSSGKSEVSLSTPGQLCRSAPNAQVLCGLLPCHLPGPPHRLPMAPALRLKGGQSFSPAPLKCVVHRGPGRQYGCTGKGRGHLQRNMAPV
jgi:hypothetical protein